MSEPKEMVQFRISDEMRSALDKLRVGRYSALSLTVMGDVALRVGIEALQREAAAPAPAPGARKVHLDVGVRGPALVVPRGTEAEEKNPGAAVAVGDPPIAFVSAPAAPGPSVS